MKLYLPTVGFYDRKILCDEGLFGSYWSSISLKGNDNLACGFDFNLGGIYPCYADDRAMGFSVRNIKLN